MSDEYDGTTIAALEFEIEELKLKLEPFQQAVDHISEDGKTTRSVSCNQWAMIHPERLTDLIICEEKLATSNNMTHNISKSCQGETCRICGQPATHKVGEEITYSCSLPRLLPNPIPHRHNYTAYVCCTCFAMIFGTTVPCNQFRSGII